MDVGGKMSSTLRRNDVPRVMVLTAPWYFSATVLILDSPIPFLGRLFPRKLFSISSKRKSPWMDIFFRVVIHVFTCLDGIVQGIGQNDAEINVPYRAGIR